MGVMQWRRHQAAAQSTEASKPTEKKMDRREIIWSRAPAPGLGQWGWRRSFLGGREGANLEVRLQLGEDRRRFHLHLNRRRTTSRRNRASASALLHSPAVYRADAQEQQHPWYHGWELGAGVPLGTFGVQPAYVLSPSDPASRLRRRMAVGEDDLHCRASRMGTEKTG